VLIPARLTAVISAEGRTLCIRSLASVNIGVPVPVASFVISPERRKVDYPEERDRIAGRANDIWISRSAHVRRTDGSGIQEVASGRAPAAVVIPV